MHTSPDFRRASVCPHVSEETIQTWLVEQIAKTTTLKPSQIDIRQTFAVYGLNSVAAAALSAELSNWFGKPIAPTIAWDYPTVKLLASHLASTYGESLTVAA